MNILKRFLFSNLLISSYKHKNSELKKEINRRKPPVKSFSKTAIELFRLKKRISKLPVDEKVLEPLLNTIERMNNELELKGVKIVDPTGTEYRDFLNFNVINYVKGELKNGKETVINTIRPEIRYKNKLYSTATVEVGVE